MTRASTLSTEMQSVLDQRRLPVMATIAVTFAANAIEWANRRQTRRALAKMEPWQLADVGLTQEQADIEAARVFWKA